LLILGLLTQAALAAQAFADDASWAGAAWRALGPLHPAAVHLPIGLLMFAGILIPLRAIVRSIPSDVIYWPLVIACISSAAACAMGWSFAPQQGYTASPFDLTSDRTLLLHRWGALLLTAWLLCVTVYATQARRRPEARKAQAIWQVAVLLAAAGVALVGHWGGKLVYGEDLLARAWSHLDPLLNRPSPGPSGQPPAPPPQSKPEAAVTVTPQTASPAPKPTASADSAPPRSEAALTQHPSAPAPGLGSGIDFRTQVAPILEASCLACHGPNKKKAGLAMHTRELLLKGGSGEPALTPGQPEQSEIIRLTSTVDPELMMPPVDHGGPLKPTEIDTLRRWVEQGAPWPAGLTLQPAKP
jgi:uncharacterized membrane protein